MYLTQAIPSIVMVALASWWGTFSSMHGGFMPARNGIELRAGAIPGEVIVTAPPAKKGTALKFLWPTSGRKIVEGYGEQADAQTGTVTLNPGITVSAPKGSAVMASESGRVSVVSWLPSYGTVVIVQHRGGYRTVYGNLETALVKRGRTVQSQERLGTSSGRVHFEVWRGGTRLNPQTVLKER